MKTLVVGSYWTTWSQPKPPDAAAGKTECGSSSLQVRPPSFEYAASQLNAYITSLPASATLGSSAPSVSVLRNGVSSGVSSWVAAMLMSTGPLGGSALVPAVGATTPAI